MNKIIQFLKDNKVALALGACIIACGILYRFHTTPPVQQVQDEPSVEQIRQNITSEINQKVCKWDATICFVDDVIVSYIVTDKFNKNKCLVGGKLYTAVGTFHALNVHVFDRFFEKVDGFWKLMPIEE